MPLRNRNTQGGKSVSSDLAPRTSRTGFGQVNDNWVGVFPPMPLPTFGSVTPTFGGYTVPITNYDSAATYVITTTAGSASQTSGTITQSGLGNNVSATVTVTVSKTGFTPSIAVISGTSQTQLPAPTFSADTPTAGGWTATITNYDASVTYSLSTTSGSVSRSGSTITQSGIGNGVSTTVTVGVSKSGFASNSGLVSGTSQSQLTTPTFSAYSYGANGAFQFTITNYNVNFTYNLSTTAGSISRSGNTVTVSGLANGQTATAFISASLAGFVTSAQGSITGMSKPACTSCGPGSTAVEGCNGATCGIIPCGSGSCPAYNIIYFFSPSPNPCVGCAAQIGGWYCCGCGGACG